MSWQYDAPRRHSDLTEPECTVLHKLERELFFLIVPDIERLPRRLYHYTNEAGFQGIIKSRGFRATYWQDLADNTEIGYGMYLIDKGFHELRRLLSDESHRQLLGICYSSFVNQQLSNTSYTYYIICFTNCPASQRHWNEYGCAAEGYCIELDSHGIPRRCGDYDVEFMPVLYDVEAQCDVVMRILTSSWKALIELAELSKWVADPRWLLRVIRLLGVHLQYHLCLLKTQAYNWEDEWRIVILGPPPAPRIEAQKRFVHFPMQDSELSTAFASVILGPGRRSTDAQEAARILAASGLASTLLRRSET
jgi:hypothetical protein